MTLSWYIDGALVNQAAASYSAATAGTNPVYIGKGYVSNYKGYIDDVRVYNRSLTGEEIGFLYNGTKGLIISNDWDSVEVERIVPDGDYYGTYSFEEDTHGTAGTSISFIDEYHGYGSGYYCDILALDGPLDGHNNYLSMRDAQGSKNTWGVHNFDDSQSSGTIEFFTRNGHVISSSRHYFYLRSTSDTIAFGMQFESLMLEIIYNLLIKRCFGVFS